MLYFLVIGLIGLPFAGSALALLAQRIKPIHTLPVAIYVASIAITLILGLILRPAQVEMILGDWSPVSFTGTPLIIAANPDGIALLIAVVAVMGLSISQENRPVNHRSLLIAGLVFAALAITVLAYDLVTLLVGLSLLDLLSGVYALLQTHHPRRVLRDALFNAASIAALAIAFTLYAASGNSLYMPLAHLPSRLMPFISIALLLRFSLLPLRSVTDRHIGIDWIGKASLAAGMLVLARLPQLASPQLHAWFFAFALLTAICALIIGALSNSRTTLLAALEAGSLALALTAAVTWQSGVIVAAAIAWLLGTTLIAETQMSYPARFKRLAAIPRIGAALCLAGLPLTVGFIGRAGVISAWAERGLGGAVLIAGMAAAQFLLTITLLRLALWQDAPTGVEEHSATDLIRFAWLFVPLSFLVLFGIAPSMLNAAGLSTQLSSYGLVGWVFWLLPTLLGALAWYYEASWLKLIANVRDRLVLILELNWWQDIVSGALNRLAIPLNGVFTFLEGDGALLWAVIVILIAVLISRPGGP
ncbi:MAG: hypothetical protein M1434_05630 [Chloroflexi bacterium]|nr:hypothetical protein [Chloroflexota bacterium]MCL5274212.1 hypothetical protein [Chloroflexota bacterium]